MTNEKKKKAEFSHVKLTCEFGVPVQPFVSTLPRQLHLGSSPVRKRGSIKSSSSSERENKVQDRNYDGTHFRVASRSCSCT